MLKNKNKGFSLVELIVAIAIMAVLIAVLAPSLLSYVERSRAQKDDSAMNEVVNAVHLSLADQKCYDEVVRYSTIGNVSCYVDTDNEDNYQEIITRKATQGMGTQYTYDDNARLLDEVQYYAAGAMRGVTITFTPEANESYSYDLKNGVVNQFFGEQCSLENLVTVYNRLRQTIGDTIKLDSQTYRNSAYTIFIKLGTTGGNQATAQDAMQVYGQFSGTNLTLDQVKHQIATYDEGEPMFVHHYSTNEIYLFEYKEGMTWESWVNSKYNSEGLYLKDGKIYTPSGKYIPDAKPTEKINGAMMGAYWFK